jgi:hypothetical protein
MVMASGEAVWADAPEIENRSVHVMINRRLAMDSSDEKVTRRIEN